jgi:hypothetical protein
LTIEQIGYVAVALLLFLLLKSLYPRREHYRHRTRGILLAEGAYLLGVFLSVALGSRGFAPILWGLLAGLVVLIRIPTRRRYVPASVKRKVIARWELENGKKYNSRTHEVHHIIPFARGGSNTEDNLRVIPRKENRSKGAKSPWWDLLAR